MKISNKLFNEQQLGQFSNNMEKIQKIQDKISSGKNIIFASDDPVGAVQHSGMKDNLSKVKRFIEKSILSIRIVKVIKESTVAYGYFLCK